jgi:hypothetical protein
MRAGPISAVVAVAAVQGNRAASVSDLKLLAINAARPIRYRSSPRRAGPCCVVIVLARVEPSLAAENGRYV